MHGAVLKQGKSVWFCALDVFRADYSVLETLTLEQVYQASRAPGKTQRMKEVLDHWQARGAQRRSLESAMVLGRVRWDELGLYPGERVSDDAVKLITGIDWGSEPSFAVGYKVVRGVSETIIEFERMPYGASRQNDGEGQQGPAGRTRFRSSTVGPFAGRRVFRLHSWGSHVPELLRGIRAGVTSCFSVGRYRRDGTPDRDDCDLVSSGRYWGSA